MPKIATILPVPEAQWIDANGNPLENGTIYTAIPGTLTSKLTYQDSDELIANTNPIVLDSAGRAIIYGSGTYRFIVRDSAGNLIYDQLTADTSSGGIANGGTSTGTANAQVIAASSFSQQDGQAVEFIAGFSNSGPMTVAPGGSPAIPVLLDTSTGPQPLSGGEVVQDNAVLLLYEAARGAFHIVNPTPGSFTGATITNSTITSSTINTTRIDLEQATDPAPTDEGRIEWSTLFNNFKVGDGSGTQRFWAGAAPGAITGCTIANNGSDATNDIDFAAGTAADSTNAFLMTLGSTLTKRLDATWAVGNNQGGLFTGAAANTTYHCFIILRPDTGVVDAGFDTSAIAANRPASYTAYRRVGSIVRTGGSIKAFFQLGDFFYWSVPVGDVSTLDPGTAVITSTITTPGGIRTVAMIEAGLTHTSGGANYAMLVTSTDQTDTDPGTAFSTGTYNVFAAATSSVAANTSWVTVRTNTSSQIRYRCGASTGSLRAVIKTFGFIDNRGQS